MHNWLGAMPNICNILKKTYAGFKRYTGIHKETFREFFDTMQQFEAEKTKLGRPSAFSLEEQILQTFTYLMA